MHRLGFLLCLVACALGSVVTLTRNVSDAQAIAVGEGILTVYVDAQRQLSFIYCSNTACQNKRVWSAEVLSGVSSPSIVVDPLTAFPVVAFYQNNVQTLSLLRCLMPDCTTSEVHNIASVAGSSSNEVFEGGIGLSAAGGNYVVAIRRVFPQLDFAQVMVVQCSNIASPGCQEKVISYGPNHAFGGDLSRNSILYDTQAYVTAVIWREGIGTAARLHVTLNAQDILLDRASNQTRSFLLGIGLYTYAAIYSGSNGTGTHPRMASCSSYGTPFRCSSALSWPNIDASIIAAHTPPGSSNVTISSGSPSALSIITCMGLTCSIEAAPQFTGSLSSISTLATPSVPWIAVGLLVDGTLQLVAH